MAAGSRRLYAHRLKFQHPIHIGYSHQRPPWLRKSAKASDGDVIKAQPKAGQSFSLIQRKAYWFLNAAL